MVITGVHSVRRGVLGTGHGHCNTAMTGGFGLGTGIVRTMVGLQATVCYYI